MTNWLKRFMNKLSAEMHEAENRVPKVPPMPEVKPPKEPDLSEPVLSFVECYRKNPGRFITNVQYCFYDVNRYTMKDKKTNQEWKLNFHYSRYASEQDSSYLPSDNAKWATYDELKYILDVVHEVSGQRWMKLDKIRKDRHAKQMANERQRLMSVYCKED